MSIATDLLESSGLVVADVVSNAAFEARRLHTHNVAAQMRGIHRIAKAFLQRPDDILQELVETAIELTGADSAAISLVRDDATDDRFFRWVASAGVYEGFLDAMLPRYPSACGVCLERGRPQVIQVTHRFFEILGVEAPPVTDGLLLPWRADDVCGTIFVMAHTRTEAFDKEDCQLMEALADFAALAVHQQKLREIEMKQERSNAAIRLANELAHEINNPLQALTNQIFLAANSEHTSDQKLAQELLPDFDRLNVIARRLLELPYLQTRAGLENDSAPETDPTR